MVYFLLYVLVGVALIVWAFVENYRADDNFEITVNDLVGMLIVITVWPVLIFIAIRENFDDIGDYVIWSKKPKNKG